MKWQLRFLRNSAFALLPAPDAVRRIKRRFAPYPADIDEWTLEQGLRMLEMLRDAGIGWDGRSALELGTGWKPLIPLLFRLAGFEHVYLVDTQRLLDESLLNRVATNLLKHVPTIAKRLEKDPEAIRARLALPADARLEHALAALGFEYLAPSDARAMQLASRSIDVVISRAVLEHIPPEVIRQILVECHRVLRVGGRMCHVIDNSDHWAHGDRSLSPLNFLRYEDSTWRWFSINPLDYQNRLRHSDYLSLLGETGFLTILDLSEPDPKAMRDLARIPISSRFAGKLPGDLATLTSYIVAAPVEGTRGAASPAAPTMGRS